MAISPQSLLHVVLFAASTLAAALPPSQGWSTPASCVRELSTYNSFQCAKDLQQLMVQARLSVEGLDIIGMHLADVIGSGATILPDKLPVTHHCYPRRIREQDPNDAPEWQWTDDDFVPFRLNLECDDNDVITGFSWH